MSRLLISKKGIVPKALLIFGVFAIAFCVISFTGGLTERHFGDSEFAAITKVAAPILVGLAGLLCITASVSYGKTCISVFDDHIEGVGIGKGALAAHNFYFHKNMNYTVQHSKALLKVSCGGETYSVSLSQADAQQVYQCIYGGAVPNYTANPQSTPNPNQNARPQPNAAPRPTAEQQFKIAVCPHCGTKCRVPAGKGLIRISCPKEGCKVPFTFES